MSGRRDLGRDPLVGIRDLLHGPADEHTGATFMRGLTLGALIGAAIAGSAIWQRWHDRPRHDAPNARADARERR